jgi:uncharacterized protein
LAPRESASGFEHHLICLGQLPRDGQADRPDLQPRLHLLLLPRKREVIPNGREFQNEARRARKLYSAVCPIAEDTGDHVRLARGEPTLLGPAYFRLIVALEKKHAQGRPVNNTLQTNGTLLDAEWCQFFHEHNFLIGLSIDGPRELHDTYRLDKGQRPTFDSVMRGIELLKKHQVEFNTLTVMSASNARHPVAVYDFLRDAGSGYIQFIPMVERLPVASDATPELDFAGPPESGQPSSPVTQWSVPSELYGDFLITIFDQWVRRDVGKVYVQMFDVIV